jgi:hypothetical protein
LTYPERRAFRLGILTGILIAVVAVVLHVLAFRAVAHPGRLDETGCHTVGKRGFTYADGRRLEPGTRHCHGTTGSAAFLGMEWPSDAEPKIKAEQDKAKRPPKAEAP